MDDSLEVVHQAMQALNFKQQAFVRAYVAGDRTAGSGTASYLKAYGGSRDAARANGARLLARPDVWRAICAFHAAADHLLTIDSAHAREA